jgi:hypothetical protein
MPKQKPPVKGALQCKGNHDHLDPRCKECARVNHVENLRCHFDTYERETPISAIQYAIEHHFEGQVQVKRRSRK